MPTQIVLPQSVKLPTWFILAASILRSIFTVLPRPGTTTLVEINTSLSAMHSQARFKRLLREDDGVEGCGLFRATPEERFHTLGNVLRLIIAIVRSPFNLLSAHGPEEADNNVRPSWLVDFAVLPDSVLSTARGGGRGQYEVTGFLPTWVVEATIENGRLKTSRQITFSKAVEDVGYTALSYPGERDYPTGTPTVSNIFGWTSVAYQTTTEKTMKKTIETQRSVELGRLADIFRGAAQCIWGKRLFTLPEILHAEKIRDVSAFRERGVDTVAAGRPRPGSGGDSARRSWRFSRPQIPRESFEWVASTACSAQRPWKWRTARLCMASGVNQASYNAASLAAACSISEDNAVNWLGVGLYLFGALLYCCVELLASTMYLEREGWVFLEDTKWGDDTAAKLGSQDYKLRTGH
ncbi:hypothetical protein B0H14DRAFT_2575828 [Mycena olivaceomarginata]|nr:hypothetical protein B0H14DRAFT_2575828 [Mycena olivaceomarginata]